MLSAQVFGATDIFHSALILAPLVLDDALVRFDDKRMAAALGILREMAKDKQVICFTCQNREAKA